MRIKEITNAGLALPLCHRRCSLSPGSFSFLLKGEEEEEEEGKVKKKEEKKEKWKWMFYLGVPDTPALGTSFMKSGDTSH